MELLIPLLHEINITQLIAMGIMLWFFYSRLDAKIERTSPFIRTLKNIVIGEEDCGTFNGITAQSIMKSGKIIIQGKEVPTASLSSYPRAVEIATTLKEWILSGKFLLTEPVAPLPGVESGITFKSLKERPIEE
jgi:hypothetical protein